MSLRMSAGQPGHWVIRTWSLNTAQQACTGYPHHIPQAVYSAITTVQYKVRVQRKTQVSNPELHTGHAWLVVSCLSEDALAGQFTSVASRSLAYL